MPDEERNGSSVFPRQGGVGNANQDDVLLPDPLQPRPHLHQHVQQDQSSHSFSSKQQISTQGCIKLLIKFAGKGIKWSRGEPFFLSLPELRFCSFLFQSYWKIKGGNGLWNGEAISPCLLYFEIKSVERI